MSAHNGGGPAFPGMVHKEGHGCAWDEHVPGMSLRDYFAGQALSAVAAHTVMIEECGVAEKCYKMADAMIAERDRRGK